MFQQPLTPVGDNLGLSFLVAILPVVIVLVLLGVLRRPAWQAALAGLIVGLVIAIGVWRMPAPLAVNSVLNGAVFALWPVMWIVVNALLLYNIAVRSGRFDAFRVWVIDHLPNDRRVVLVVIGFCFGALLEGVSGFGTPVAITSSLLILVGFPPIEALVFVLIFNTAPVAFGALGVPVTVLGAVTGLPATAEFAITGADLSSQRQVGSVAPWQGWLPWLIVSGVVIVWTHLAFFKIGQQSIPWPGLHNAISITLYNNKPYAALWVFQPLGTGTAILLAAIITALVVRLSPDAFFDCVARTARQVWLAVVTVMLIIGLAYLMNYSGIAYTLGQAAASTGHLFVLLSPFLGWVAVMLSGSDTSGNALFGNLQVVAARQLNLNPVLFAATNSSGGVMGKMISPQNIATGVSVTNLKGHEGVVFARTFIHSIVLTLALSVLVAVQQYLIPWIIPTVGGVQ